MDALRGMDVNSVGEVVNAFEALQKDLEDTWK